MLIVIGGLAAVALIAALFAVLAFRLLSVLVGGSFMAAPAPISTAETVILGAALGVFAGFVHSFNLGVPWPELLQFAVAVAATYGVNVITGSAFANLFNLPQGVLIVISLGLGGVEIGAPYFGVSSTLAGVIQGAVAFALALGFGTKVSAAASQRSRARA